MIVQIGNSLINMDNVNLVTAKPPTKGETASINHYRINVRFIDSAEVTFTYNSLEEMNTDFCILKSAK